MNVRKLGGNVTAKILSVVFAVILWFHVTTTATFNSKYTLPIRYVGPSEGYVLASETPDKATIVIGGTGSDLVGFYLSGFVHPENRYALVNLTGLPEGDTTAVIDRTQINFGLFSDLRVENILYPDNASIPVTIDRMIKRTVSVDIGGRSDYPVRNGHAVVNITAKPSYVVIEGPAGVVESNESIPVESFHPGKVSPADTVLSATLASPDFLTVEPGEVELQVTVEPLATRRINGLPLTLVGFPRRDRPSFVPDSLSATFKGPKSLVNALNKTDIVLALEYGWFLDTLAHGDSLIAPTITLPDTFTGVEVADLAPEAVRLAP